MQRDVDDRRRRSCRPASPGMDLLPSNIDLSAAEVQLVHEVAREQTLQRVLAAGHRAVRRHPDRLPALARPAHRQRADRLRRRDRAAGVRVLRAARRRAAQDHDRQGAASGSTRELQIDGVLGTMYDGRTLHGREVMERLVEAWGDTVFHTVIRRTVKFSDSTVAGEPITTLRLDLAGRRGLPPARQGGAGPVSRRVSLPAADDLFRPTVDRTPRPGDAASAGEPSPPRGSRRRSARPAAGSGTTRR